MCMLFIVIVARIKPNAIIRFNLHYVILPFPFGRRTKISSNIFKSSDS